jgi:trigger factor
MQITLDKHSNTLATLRVNLVEEDYGQLVEKKLKDYRKKAHFKGFRPGMVPMEMVKKMYGKSVLIDEINHKLSHAVSDYIKENSLPIVGDPLPNIEEASNIDWDTQKTFDFTYNLGLSGAFELDFGKIKPIDSYEITADNLALEKAIDDLRHRYAEHQHAEAVADGDMIYGTFSQNDWTEKSAIPMKAIAEAQKKLFIGAKKGDTLSFDVQGTFTDAKALALATAKKEDEVQNWEGTLSFEIEDITRNTPSELNDEFFAKVLGPDKVANEAEFRAEILETIKNNYKREAEYLAKIDAEKAAIEAFDIELPDEFLKNWLIDINKGKFTADDVERDFENVKKDIRWSLIKNKIADEAGIKVEYPEILERTKAMVRAQFGMYGNTDMDDMIDKIANNYLTEKKDKDGQDRFMQMFNAVYNEKVQTALLERVKVNKKIVSADEFKAIVEK